MTTEFIMSNAEMTRRKKAFITLAVSLVVGLMLTALQFIVANVWFAGTCIVIFVAFLALAVVLFFKFVNASSKTKIYVNDHSLQRIREKKVEAFLLKDIKKIGIKKTTRKTIRRIKIVFINKSTIFVSGLENFEQFKKDLINNVGKDVILEQSYERIDYDHPLFYVIFGLLASFVSVKVLKLVAALDYHRIKFIFALSYMYVAMVGIFFIVYKPTSKEYGKESQITDYVLGLLMVCAGISLYLFGR